MFDYSAAEKLLASRREFPTTIKYLWNAVGGLSEPGKMPWYGWSISAEQCNMGSKLRHIENSVCSICYARKNRYCFDNVKLAHERRYGVYDGNPAVWAVNMVALLEAKAKGKPQWFRWFDSGDVQDRDMAQAIIWIASKLPHIRFWLPTKEYELFGFESVRQLVAETPNLTVRISAPMIGQMNSAKGYVTSSVSATGATAIAGVQCPARFNDGKCGDCRACWRPDIGNVNYTRH